ncbi:hypothetical protein ACO1M6_13995, partial [Staphylococcus aureus]
WFESRYPSHIVLIRTRRTSEPLGSRSTSFGGYAGGGFGLRDFSLGKCVPNGQVGLVALRLNVDIFVDVDP